MSAKCSHLGSVAQVTPSALLARSKFGRLSRRFPSTDARSVR
jgi:hypothetical protein